METINCIFCNKNQEDPIVIEENGYTGRRCHQCGLVYVSPRPNQPDIVDLYRHDEANKGAQAHITSGFIKRIYARHSLSILRRHVRDGLLLEIGAGAGYFLDEARKQGFDTYGTELNIVQADFINTALGIPCEMNSLPDAFVDRTFDVVYHCDVLSHFYNPISEFRAINAKMNIGGILVFETGNLGDVNPQFYKTYPKFQFPDHLFFFSEKNVRDILDLAGFELITIHRYSIVWQLRLSRWLVQLLRILRGGHQSSDRSSDTFDKRSALAARSSKSTGLKILLRKSGDLFFYFIRYKVGYMLPKYRRPQTIIVVARKARSFT